MKKNLKLSLAAAVLLPVFTLSETTVPLIAGGGTVTPESIVGNVIVSNNDTDLTVKYEINAEHAYDWDKDPVENVGKWFIAKTDTEVGTSLDSFPLTKAGAPKIGKFSEKDEWDRVALAEVIVNPIPAPDGDGNVTIGAHAEVTQLTAVELDYLATEGIVNITLPQDVNLTVVADTYTYISAEIESNDDLNGLYPHSWCIDPENHINPGVKYSTVRAISSYDPNLQVDGLYHDYITAEVDDYPAHIIYPENLPQVNYVVNQFDAGAYDGYENARCQVQEALWQIANGKYGVCSGWSESDSDDVLAVADIVNDAAANHAEQFALNGVGYKPGCNDEMVVVLLGDPDSSTDHIQATIVHIPTPCKQTWGEETAWGGNYEGDTTIDRFIPNNWAMWFEHTITQ